MQLMRLHQSILQHLLDGPSHGTKQLQDELLAGNGPLAAGSSEVPAAASLSEQCLLPWASNMNALFQPRMDYEMTSFGKSAQVNIKRSIADNWSRAQVNLLGI